MKTFKPALIAIVTGLLVAVVYYCFEFAVRHSQDFIWNDLFDSGGQRLLVIPICIVLTFVYFGAQEILDKKSRGKISEGLGSVPDPSLKNFGIVLLLGFLSLIAGASLGPEAILVPACVILGDLIGKKVADTKGKQQMIFGSLGLVALFAAFFNSFWVGLLGLAIIKRQLGIKPDRQMIVLAVLASASTVLALKYLESEPYVSTPPVQWDITLANVLASIGLFLAGFVATHVMGAVFSGGRMIIDKIKDHSWMIQALLAGGVLSAIYMLGGTLIEFTGNESIIPMYHQAGELGIAGLVWILAMKILAIAWSKASGYRGGLIFPSIFVASVLAVIAQQYDSNLNIVVGLTVALVGMLVADKKVKVLL